MELEPDFLNRYPRQFTLKEIGIEGQQALRNARVLVVGAGGLGCPALQYLTAAGVGCLGIADGDTVALSNLQRQTLYAVEDIGKPKVRVAAEKLKKINPYTEIIVYEEFLKEDNAEGVLSAYDLILDCSDNFEARYLINDTCAVLDKPWIYASVSAFEAQVACFNVKLPGHERTCNYRDIFATPPGKDDVANCEMAGVIGAVPGITGTLQALEAIKFFCKTGELCTNELLIFDALTLRFETFKFPAQNKQNSSR